MPIDSSIALGTKVADPMQSLSGMLNVQNTMQGMQARDLQMTGQDQQNQQGAIDLQERKAMQSVIADPAHRNQDGSINYNSLLPAAMQVAPTTGMKYIGQIATADKQNTEAKSAIMGLASDKRAQFGQIANTLIGQPLDVINNALNATAQQSPELGSAVPWIQQQIKSAYDSGGQPAVDAGLKRISDGTQAPPTQQAMNTPNAVGISNNIQSGLLNTKPGVAGVPQNSLIPGSLQTQMVPLASQQGTGTDVNGNPIVTRKDSMGNVQAPAQMPGSTSQPMINFPPGESPDTKSALEKEALGAKNVALGAPAMHSNNQGILHELDNVISTGATGQIMARAASIAGIAPNAIPGASAAEKAASAYDMIGKYTERNALQAAASMGPGTNAGLEAQIKANGSAAYNPTALKNITKLNDAVVTGSEKYSQGLQAAIDNGGKGVFAKRQFDQQWSQNADVNTLKFLNAAKTGNTTDVQSIIQSVGGQNSAGGKKLVQQLQNLQSLTTKGSL